jgi:protein-tyrosine phosphatase
MRSVLFVCTANICRSPMAEGALRAILAAKGIDPDVVNVESAGTHDYHTGEPPFSLAASAAKRRGYDIGNQVARRVLPNDFDRFDHILAMDRSNLVHLRSICPTRCKHKVELLLEYGDEHHGKEVPDPYGGKPQDFERALDMIEDGCRGLALLLARAA